MVFLWLDLFHGFQLSCSNVLFCILSVVLLWIYYYYEREALFITALRMSATAREGASAVYMGKATWLQLCLHCRWLWAQRIRDCFGASCALLRP